MATASVRTAVSAKPGERSTWRTASRTSRARTSKLNAVSVEFTRSRVTVGLPKRSSAARRAFSRVIPAARFSSVRISMCACNSASISRSTCERRNKLVMRLKMAMLFLRSWLLFAAQRLHGVDARCAARGHKTRNRCYTQQQCRNAGVSDRIEVRDPKQKRRDGAAGDHGSAQPNHESQRGETHPLANDESENVGARSAQ